MVAARCYNVRYVNGILNIYFRVRGRCARCARLCAQGILEMSAGVGTIFARQNPCQIGRSVLVILHTFFVTLFTDFGLLF